MASKKMRGISLALILIMMLASCKESNVDVFTDDETKIPDAYVTPDVESNSDSTFDTDKAEEVGQGDKIDNPFIDTSKNPVSFVSATADVKSYKHFRDLVNSGYSLNELKKCSYSFKNEEFLNYFANAQAKDGEFSSNIKIYPCSWNSENYILKFTFAAPKREYSEKNNFVFYVDVSESMGGENMLPAITNASRSFVGALSENDVVSIVTSENEDKIRLDSVKGNDGERIAEAIEALMAHGTLNNHDSLASAYEVARKNYISDGQNTVIIVSDGDISEKYSELIEENADAGIHTSVIAVGSGNYKNKKLEGLSNLGGGEYYYVDGKDEAELVMSKSIFFEHTACAGGLSVKVDFDTDVIEKYRLIGYEGEILQADIEGGENKNVDTLFAGENITLCYEISLLDGGLEATSDFANITVKYLTPDGEEVTDSFSANTENIVENDAEMETVMRAIETLMVLRSSPYGKNIKLADVYIKLSQMDFEEYPKAEELYNLLGIITGNIKK